MRENRVRRDWNARIHIHNAVCRHRAVRIGTAIVFVVNAAIAKDLACYGLMQRNANVAQCLQGRSASGTGDRIRGDRVLASGTTLGR